VLPKRLAAMATKKKVRESLDSMLSRKLCRSSTFVWRQTVPLAVVGVGPHRPDKARPDGVRARQSADRQMRSASSAGS